jgi:cyclopropane-fatty-acyl-phospholipid synthase
MSLQPLLESVLGADLAVRVRAYDGSSLGPADAPATVVIRTPDAMHRLVTGLGRELAFARAYVAGDIDIDGDIYSVIALKDRMGKVRATPTLLREAARAAGVKDVRSLLKLRPLPPPDEEIKLRGRRHTKARDAEAIKSHYDVSNDFYRMILGPSLTYSCAVFEHPDDTLERAQSNKYELICRKLDLAPGMRLLDIGCGWGGMVLHAARHHGVTAVGITISPAQAELARKRVVDAGLADRVDIRIQDYRDVHDGPFDAVSSIGMFEHVGLDHLGVYFQQIARLLRPGGRLLNHGICRPAGQRERLNTKGFLHRYVFPDGELMEVGKVISAIQATGLEVRHSEGLREHYARTLRHWVANLERQWDAAVREVGEPRARIWRLYMAGSALAFESGQTHIHQVLAVAADHGRSGLPLRPDFDRDGLATG